MKKQTMSLAVGLMTAAMILFGGAALTAFAEPPAANAATQSKEGKITIKGTATIYGDWSCEGNADIQTTPGEALSPVPGFPGGVQTTLVKVNVKTIECGDGTMNKHMRKALKEKDFPEIQFQTNRYTLNENGDVVSAVGDLTIAGVTKPVELDASLVSSPEGGFQVEGKVDIQMKDYKVKPPSLLFGTLKVADDVSIQYTANIAPPNQIAASLKAQ